MIPVLYRNEEKDFVTNGIGRLSDCISCTVTEERNGIYECEFVYPITGDRYEDITEGCIIYCTHDDTQIPQPFEIYGHTAPIDGQVTFYAHHISYKLNKLVVMPFTASSIAETFAKIKTNTATATEFDFWTDKSTIGPFRLEVPSAVRGVLGGQEGSVLDVYGKGDYEWDMFTVKLHQDRGQASGVEIRYGKNLVDINDEVSAEDTYNAVVPYWASSDESGEIVLLPEGAIIYSEATRRTVDLTDHLFNILRNEDNEPIEAIISIKETIPLNLSDEFESAPTISQLREKAITVLETSGGWLPQENIEVDFVALWQTEEYKEFAPLQRVRLCDTVSVYYPELGVEAVEKRVVKTTYNVLLERYDKIELGDLQHSFSQIVAESLKEEVPTKSMMQSAIDNATKLISGGLGGHVYLKPNANGHPEEILIMDDEDYTQATKLWRWNLNGLGYSNTGYNGYYGTAITMDGQIVADYITTGTLNANLIKAGVLSDVNGNTTFNLDTGELVMSTGYINLGNGNFSVNDWGYIYAKYGEIAGFEISSDYFRKEVAFGNSKIRTSLYSPSSVSATVFDIDYIVDNTFTNVFRIGTKGSVFISPLGSTEGNYGNSTIYILNDYISLQNSVNNSAVVVEDSGVYVAAGNNGTAKLSSSKGSVLANQYGLTIVTGRSTTAHSGNLYITGAGIAYFANEGSSSRYVKHDIQPVENDELKAENLYDAEVIQYKYNDDFLSDDDPNRGKDLVGFIVEDLDKVYPCAVQKEDEKDSTTWTWSPYRIIPAMLKLIQDQHKEIEKLKS